jgi:hypothetical protein
MKNIMNRLVYLFVFLMSANANAAFIIDTGPGLPSPQGSTLNSDQWIAAEVVLDQQYSLTSIEAWIKGNAQGNLTLAIYDNGIDNTPEGANELFSTEFTAGNTANWYGAFDLSWTLNAGTYWVAFEIRDSNTFNGSFTAAGNPLDNYSFVDGTSDEAWRSNTVIDLGVRIGGIVNVSAPSALFILMSSLLALFLVRKRSKRFISQINIK